MYYSDNPHPKKTLKKTVKDMKDREPIGYKKDILGVDDLYHIRCKKLLEQTS